MKREMRAAEFRKWNRVLPWILDRRGIPPLRGQCSLREQGERLAATVGMTGLSGDCVIGKIRWKNEMSGLRRWAKRTFFLTGYQCGCVPMRLFPSFFEGVWLRESKFVHELRR
jgi:hypothetical protein